VAGIDLDDVQMHDGVVLGRIPEDVLSGHPDPGTAAWMQWVAVGDGLFDLDKADEGFLLPSFPLRGFDLPGFVLSGFVLSGFALRGVPLSGVPLSGVPLSGFVLGGRAG
jgi:hypothetical protein